MEAEQWRDFVVVAESLSTNWCNQILVLLLRIDCAPGAVDDATLASRDAAVKLLRRDESNDFIACGGDAARQFAPEFDVHFER